MLRSPLLTHIRKLERFSQTRGLRSFVIIGAFLYAALVGAAYLNETEPDDYYTAELSRRYWIEIGVARYAESQELSPILAGLLNVESVPEALDRAIEDLSARQDIHGTEWVHPLLTDLITLKETGSLPDLPNVDPADETFGEVLTPWQAIALEHKFPSEDERSVELSLALSQTDDFARAELRTLLAWLLIETGALVSLIVLLVAHGKDLFRFGKSFVRGPFLTLGPVFFAGLFLFAEGVSFLWIITEGTFIPFSGEDTLPNHLRLHLFRIVPTAVCLAVLFRWRGVALPCLGLTKAPKWSYCVLGTCAVIVVDALLYRIDFEIFHFSPLPAFDPWADYFWGSIFLGISGVVLAPIFEEIVFRGILFAGFYKKLGPWKAAIISSLAFSLLHLYDPLGALAVFIFGMMACYLYRRTQSLWTPIIVHAVTNAAILTYYWRLYHQAYLEF